MCKGIISVTESEFQEKLDRSDYYELFSDIKSMGISKEIIDKLKKKLSKGYQLDNIESKAYSCAGNKYAVVYLIHSFRVTTRKTNVKGLRSHTFYYYTSGNISSKLVSFYWEKGSKWEPYIPVVRVGNSHLSKFKVIYNIPKNKTASKPLFKDILDKSCEVEMYLRERELLYSE